MLKKKNMARDYKKRIAIPILIKKDLKAII